MQGLTTEKKVIYFLKLFREFLLGVSSHFKNILGMGIQCNLEDSCDE